MTGIKQEDSPTTDIRSVLFYSFVKCRNSRPGEIDEIFLAIKIASPTCAFPHHCLSKDRRDSDRLIVARELRARSLANFDRQCGSCSTAAVMDLLYQEPFDQRSDSIAMLAEQSSISSQ